MKAAAALAASGHGAVTNISSVFGASGGFGTSPAYHAAKGAVRTLTKDTALRWAGRGMGGEPGASRIHRHPPTRPDQGTRAEHAMTGLTPLGRLGQPTEVAAGVAYLASDDASFVAGLELRIDGGYMAR